MTAWLLLNCIEWECEMLIRFEKANKEVNIVFTQLWVSNIVLVNYIYILHIREKLLKVLSYCFNFFNNLAFTFQKSSRRKCKRLISQLRKRSTAVTKSALWCKYNCQARFLPISFLPSIVSCPLFNFLPFLSIYSYIDRVHLEPILFSFHLFFSSLVSMVMFKLVTYYFLNVLSFLLSLMIVFDLLLFDYFYGYPF